MVAAGMDVARLNFAHGTLGAARGDRRGDPDGGRARRPRRRDPRRPSGPKLRIGPVAGGVAELARDSRVVLTPESVEGTSERLPVAWQGFAELVDEGDVLYLADGAVRLRVTR